MKIWEKYKKSDEYLTEHSIIDRANWYWDMYLGMQWKGVKVPTKLPVMNIIQQVVDYKTAAIGQNQMTCVFSDAKQDPMKDDLYKTLNSYWTNNWKRQALDTKMYEMVLESQVQGDSYLYIADKDTSMLIPDTSILLADEQNPDIQSQSYIMIRYRPFINEVKEEARRNGVPESDIAAISTKSNPDYLVGNKEDLNYSDTDGKTTAVIYFEKKAGIVYTAKACEECVFRPLQPLTQTNERGEEFYSARLYPVVKLTCRNVPNSARGRGTVVDMIPNQIELNKTYARSSASIMNTAYTKVAYDRNAVMNPDALTEAGAPIEVNGSSQAISNMITYLQGVPMSGDVFNYIEEMFTKTKVVAGASDAITGISDPTRVSGNAISEIREQSTITLKGNVIRLKQCYADIAKVMLDSWKLYFADGIEFQREPNLDERNQMNDMEADNPDLTERIKGEDLRALDADVTIDVTLRTEATKDATQGILDTLRDGQYITFDEWVEASDENGTVPVQKLMKIIEERKAQAAMQQPMQGQQIPQMQGQPMQGQTQQTPPQQ